MSATYKLCKIFLYMSIWEGFVKQPVRACVRDNSQQNRAANNAFMVIIQFTPTQNYMITSVRYSFIALKLRY